MRTLCQTIVLAGLSLAGCKDPAQEQRAAAQAIEAANAAVREQREATAKQAEAAAQLRVEAQRKLQPGISGAQERADLLRPEVASATGASKVKAEAALRALDMRLDVARASLTSMSLATETDDRWRVNHGEAQDAVAAVQAALVELETAVAASR